jgi:uncharacterized repeat protein (TIGR01451 family)
VTNFGPSLATNVVVTNLLPAGTVLTGTSPTNGVTHAAGVVTWRIGSLARDAFTNLTLVIQTGAASTITNWAVATTDTADPNPDDDSASLVTTVINPTADLELSIVDVPDPAWIGLDLTYTITVSNPRGVGTAPGVTVIDTLPPGTEFISASPDYYTNTVAGLLAVTFPDLGSVGSNRQATAEIVVRPTVPGEPINTAVCRLVDDGTGVTDPFKANNSASIKTIVEQVPLTIAPVGGGLAISWPAGGNYILESTTDLSPPVVWMPVTDAVPALVGGQMTVIVPIGPGNRFFRLRYSTEPLLMLGVSHEGDKVTLTWPINSWNAKLESATSLQAPIDWTAVTDPLPTTNGGKNTVTLDVDSGSKVFRLRVP